MCVSIGRYGRGRRHIRRDSRDTEPGKQARGRPRERPPRGRTNTRAIGAPTKEAKIGGNQRRPTSRLKNITRRSPQNPPTNISHPPPKMPDTIPHRPPKMPETIPHSQEPTRHAIPNGKRNAPLAGATTQQGMAAR